EMEISIADMAENRSDEAEFGDLALGCSDALRQARDRHADVGSERLRAGAQGAARPIGVVSRLPQPRAVLGLGRPFERAAVKIARGPRGGPRPARRPPPASRGIQRTASAPRAARAWNRDWSPSPAARRAARCAPPGRRTGWSRWRRCTPLPPTETGTRRPRSPRECRTA